MDHVVKRFMCRSEKGGWWRIGHSSAQQRCVARLPESGSSFRRAQRLRLGLQQQIGGARPRKSLVRQQGHWGTPLHPMSRNMSRSEEQQPSRIQHSSKTHKFYTNSRIYNPCFRFSRPRRLPTLLPQGNPDR